ncbi:chromosome segregation SMC family protein [Pelagibacterium halotolerans]|uniref:Chromosome partition protein Smc n=1 Tax=Pelagibacterium halotolerans (strain DSM 22347 / JCM 15775 / CGMCC 1.7692 / B2) TaxID=1082931 RepID=G4RB54_PELHB|nr:AAA family ATPase [Pelagibacterium halotolerans]AEQ50563.1 chromosome partition protein smc [Pelagibacterium halotolerans B2]QJR19490.1 AAA family ATPase [Pelagibacterium halotolerans]SDZ89876.1 condensin subunit Smc [Pelagibacterium halotolerans]
MKFSRLKLLGFKSFTDPVELVLEPGITGVVGPNGCGKSNLVEALRWVMGESSYKAMRASGMDDVIFSGSGNRPARNSAEVTVVLDNSDRTAPQAFNTADTIEISRRIEREQGSVYRINGRDVRARDVQLMFADASTGAHSPALVRQGQIGELIAAKPTQRRALLEEAAGISGLHSRRHEAELRLRAAEQNLERVDDIIAQVEVQLETLKRQARQATRYRALSGDIRRAEATLYHIRWVQTRYAEKETEAQQGRLVNQLAEASHLEHQAKKLVEAMDAELQPLRDADAAAGAVLQRLTILRGQLEDELRRANSRRAELDDRLKQIDTDIAREAALIVDSEGLIETLEGERLELAETAEAENEASEMARAQADEARAALDEAEAAARSAADAVAAIRAQRTQATRAAEEAGQRVARLESQQSDIARDVAALEESLAADHTVAERQARLDEVLEAFAIAEAEVETAEIEASEAVAALEAAQPQLADIEGRLNRLESEAETLARVLNVDGGSLWPAIVDALRVAPGMETALGAALGDDLEASDDTAAPLYWTESTGPHDPALPEGVTALSSQVSGTHLLKRRLDQIGIVDNAADGARLMALLKPGQRLVSRDGGLWRWDGFVAKPDAPSAAAQRLSQRNRLAELDSEITGLRATRNRAVESIANLRSRVETTREMETTRRAAWREAQRGIAAAQAGVDAAHKNLAELTARRGALAESRARIEENLAEAVAVADEARAALEELGAEGDAVREAETRQRALANLREAAEQARVRLAGFESASQMRTSRLSRIGQELESWQRRRAGAQSQIETLERRKGEIEAQISELNATPDAFDAKRAELEDQIEDAEYARKRASDKLNEAQGAFREADKAARLAAEGLADTRAEMARVEERLKGNMATRQQIERQIAETLGISADKTAEAAGIRPEAALPDEKATEARVDRLKAERERLGGVNLMAEQEAEEVQDKLDKMVTDREDLIAAIAKLRTGISNLNREGRARLNEAFEKVNTHFRELFTTLFGGGTAELTFVESDDPLQAGLEIIAKPPGKKPQTMTLLSGGEQALTAMSLIFAVFLTNPAPICVLDEVDAPLDDANVERFCNLLESMRQRTDTRFVVITHNPITMARMDRLFGVTMPERGVSQLVSVDLRTAETFLEAS